MSKVIGMDLGDKRNAVVVLDEDGEKLLSRSIGNTSQQIQKFFSRYAGSVVVMEAGTHSPWISRLLKEMGLKVLVGNPRKLKLIWQNDQKNDFNDAMNLALMYRLEPRLLNEVFHRSEEAQLDLVVIKVRMHLVECRSKSILHVRSTVKGFGHRLSACSSSSFASRARKELPEHLKPLLMPVLDHIENLTKLIKQHDHRIEELCQTKYLVTELFRKVSGVGPITALSYILTLEDPTRFEKSRQVGAFLGLTPRQDQSGQTDKQLPITKAGNSYMRQLLVSCAHYILGPFGPDSDLRRAGLRIANRGGKNAKKRAVVAVARKLAVLLHRIWADRSIYKPFPKEGSTIAA